MVHFISGVTQDPEPYLKEVKQTRTKEQIPLEAHVFGFLKKATKTRCDTLRGPCHALFVTLRSKAKVSWTLETRGTLFLLPTSKGEKTVV